MCVDTVGLGVFLCFVMVVGSSEGVQTRVILGWRLGVSFGNRTKQKCWLMKTEKILKYNYLSTSFMKVHSKKKLRCITKILNRYNTDSHQVR